MTGPATRAVTTVPAGSVAGLRPPAITAAVPPAAPAAPPSTAPLPPPRIAPRIAPPDRRAADLARALVAGRVAVAVDGLGAERQLGAVSQHERVEPHAEPRRILHLAAAIDQHDRAEHPRAGGNRALPVGHHVAGDPRFDAILDFRRFARQRAIDLEADDRRCRHDDFDVARLGRGRRLRGARRRPAAAIAARVAALVVMLGWGR